MGCISNFNLRPGTWPAVPGVGVTRPAYGSYPLVRVEYGTYDDGETGSCPMSILMRKPVYDGLVSGQYRLDAKTTLSEQTLVVMDGCGNRLQPLAKDVVF